MSGDLLLSVCFNHDTMVEQFQIPYNITWADLEAMLKAQYDNERISVTYMDTDDDEVSINSQEELFEAFRVAMATNNILQVKVMPLAREAAMFRMPYVEPDFPREPDMPSEQEIPREPDTTNDDITEPLQLRDVCPDPSVAIAMPDVEKDRTEGHETQATGGGANTEAGANTEPTIDEAAGKILLPDSNMEVIFNTETNQWEPRVMAGCPADQQTEAAQTREPAVEQEVRIAGSLYEELAGSTRDGGNGEDRSEQNLPYSDFVVFMTKLKKELRAEIVRDVTRKTVKQVLKGLDGAVLESLHQAGVASTQSLPGALPAACEQEHRSYVHDGVFCDNCNIVISGPRYKCGNCLDYDLCETCEALPGIHDDEHAFVKIRRPCYGVGMVAGVRKPLLRSLIYRPHRKTKMVVPIYGETAEDVLNFKLESKMKDIFARNEDKRRKKDEKKMAKLKKKEEKLKRRLESMHESPLKRERLDLLDDESTVRYDFYKVMMGAQYLACISIPDSTELQPETKFIKSWKMKNDGDGPWSASTKLKLLWGNIATPDIEVDVPALAPGEEGAVSVEFISPAEPGQYQSHWKMFEHGMQFGSRIWCSIRVVPRETLEPTSSETNSLEIVKETPQTAEKPDSDEIVASKPEDQIAITFKVADEEHLREICVKREIVADTVKPEISIATSQQEVEENDGKQEVVTEDDSARIADAMAEVTKVEVRDAGKEYDSEDGGFVVYAKQGNAELFEVQTRESVKEKDSPVTLEEDLTTAVARLTLDSEKRDAELVPSQTATPTNTPFDVTPMKTPNPEPAGPEDEPEHLDMKPISNSSSVELVPGPEMEEYDGDQLDKYVHQRLANLELKPDIDLDSLSSYSDDDESSLSDSDYIIVPLPDCFDITKPLSYSATLSTYSGSTERGDISLDDNHNTLPTRESRGASVDDILTASSSIPVTPLCPTRQQVPAVAPPQQVLSVAPPQQVLSVAPPQQVPAVAPPQAAEGSATSVEADKGGDSTEKVVEAAELPGSSAGHTVKVEAVRIVMSNEVDQPAGVSSPVVHTEGGSTGESSGVSSPDSETSTTTSSGSSTSESGASGAESASSPESSDDASPRTDSSAGEVTGTDSSAGEVTGDETMMKEPVSASAQMPENVHFIKAGEQDKHAQKSVDFAPDFANQLVATAVNAAGQAYITAKAVFKTWQDKQTETKNLSDSKSQPKQPESKNQSNPKPTGWKPASTQWSPPTEDDYKPPTNDWKSPKSDFKPPESEWKPATSNFKPPQSNWKPPQSEFKLPSESEFKLPSESEFKLPAESEPTPPKEQWKPPKESGPMGKLFEMGFYDREVNRKLLIKHNNDIRKVVQELLSMKNKDWHV